MMKRKYLILIILLITCFGCVDLETKPTDTLSSALFWETKTDAVNFLNGIYGYLPGIDEVNWDGLSEIAHANSGLTAYNQIEKSEHNANTGLFSTQWDGSYKAIRAVNYFLENVDLVKEKDITFTTDARLKAEARFIRAYYYMRLTMYFGDIPLVTKSLDLSESANFTKSTQSQIWDFVSAEFAAIVNDLPVNYTGSDIGRITKGAALGMRARAMLYAGRYQEALTSAKAVMDLNVYELYPKYEKLFDYEGQNNKEVIFDRQYAKDVFFNNFFATHAPISMNGSVGMSPTRTLIDAYYTTNGLSILDDPGYNIYSPYRNRDPRMKYSIFLTSFSDTVPGSVLYNGFNYDARPGSGTTDEIEKDYVRSKTGFSMKKYVNEADKIDRTNCATNFIYLRYADVLLMYAEAKVELNQIDQTVYDAFNKIRQRADVKMPVVSSGKTQGQLREIIRHERMVELALEGLRFYDLRRWKTAHLVMQGTIPGLRYIRKGTTAIITYNYGGITRHFDETRDYLFPIPQQEIILNPNLKPQNPGY